MRDCIGCWLRGPHGRDSVSVRVRRRPNRFFPALNFGIEVGTVFGAAALPDAVHSQKLTRRVFQIVRIEPDQGQFRPVMGG